MPTIYSPIRIIFADDHEVVREGFEVMMKKQNEIEIIGMAKDGEELVRLTRQLKPDVMVTDVQMPKMNGMEAAKQILSEFKSVGIIAFSMYEEESVILDMLKVGASGYLLKNSPREEIIDAIKAVHSGQEYYSRQTSKIITEGLANIPEFTEREREIINLICEGNSNIEIAEKLCLSRRTIESHRLKIMQKTNTKNGVGIALYAIKNKLYFFKK